MPFSFKFDEDISRYSQYKSVLIVPCRLCPAASSAVKNDRPYFEFLRRFLKTDSYDRYVKSVRSKLDESGVRTGIFHSRLLHQFVLCMWTSRRRKKLAETANEYEALAVLGCEAAVQTVNDATKSCSCQVVRGLESEGVMSIRPRFHLPCNLSLQLESLTPVSLQDSTTGQAD